MVRIVLKQNRQGGGGGRDFWGCENTPLWSMIMKNEMFESERRMQLITLFFDVSLVL